jgi:lipopolysaccharide/colanic/teichoic acid biosynthesis glycosyltransferase
VTHKTYALKAVLDYILATAVVIGLSWLLLGTMLAVWLQDFQSPFYMARRVGRGDKDFTMIKIRSMVKNAEATGVNSTGAGDARITGVGRFIRRYKIDELSQFLNVLRGDMSVVGPRPNTRKWGVDLYTDQERRLLSLKPGITDLSSIVFSDEGSILADAEHPDLRYNQIIRPWKSRLGLFYLEHATLSVDLQIVFLTAIAVLNKPAALRGVLGLLEQHGAPPELIAVCRRDKPLPEAPPPGGNNVDDGALYAHTR